MSILQMLSRKTSSRRQINLKGVREDILLLPDDQYRLVLEVAPINFKLKSEDEKDAIIGIYESFLNSLPCAIQILVRIRELDMSDYIADVKERAVMEQEEVYQNELNHYADFVKQLIGDYKILSRHFYIVLPYAGHKNIDFATAKEQLVLNADIVSDGLRSLGMHTRQLNNIEILDLFRSFYNPDVVKDQPLKDSVASLLNSAYVRKATND